MIDWIHQFCRDWGDARYHIDNCKAPPTSIWGRIKEGWSISSAECATRPDPPEVMIGNALLISIAIRSAIDAGRLTERQFQVLYVHYAARDATKRKIYAIGMSKKRYYEMIHRAHRILRYFLPTEGVGDKIVETIDTDSVNSMREAQCA